MKRYSIYLTLIALCGFFLLSSVQSSHAQKTKWLTFSSQRGGFKIKMPGTPETKQEDKKWGKSYKSQLKDGDLLYYVSYGKHNQNMPDPENLAQVSLGAFVTQVGGEISDPGDWKVGKNVGRKAKIKVPDKGFSMYYHVIFKGRTQYQVVMATAAGEPDPKAYKKFIKSFKFL